MVFKTTLWTSAWSDGVHFESYWLYITWNILKLIFMQNQNRFKLPSLLLPFTNLVLQESLHFKCFDHIVPFKLSFSFAGFNFYPSYHVSFILTTLWQQHDSWPTPCPHILSVRGVLSEFRFLENKWEGGLWWRVSSPVSLCATAVKFGHMMAWGLVINP